MVVCERLSLALTMLVAAGSCAEKVGEMRGEVWVLDLVLDDCCSTQPSMSPCALSHTDDGWGC